MSVEQLDRIDAISTTPEGKIKLTISDHLNWEDEASHSLLLQDKIAAYLEFIEAGQLVENYPDAIDKETTIYIYFKFLPPENALIVLEHIAVFFHKKQIDFKWQLLDAVL